MAGPDYTQYVDLRFFDKDPQNIFDTALQDLQLNLPEWSPREGNVETLLLEALALEVAESMFAIDRLPSSIMEILLNLYKIQRDVGTRPTTMVTFTVADSLGHDIPSGIMVKVNLSGGLEPVVFTTDSALTIPLGSSMGTVSATGDRFTSQANGITAGTLVDLLDSVTFVEEVRLASTVTNGRDPEPDSVYLNRGVQRLNRISDTLVLPKHFTSFVLENPIVNRAFVVDSYTPALVPEPVISSVTSSSSGGSLAAATYGYRITATNSAGETLPSSEQTVVVSSGTTNSNTIDWTLVSVPPALPTDNTTGVTVGSAAGYITLAIYGFDRFLTSDEKTTINSELVGMSQANLSVAVIDPTITTVDVNASVKAMPGYTSAQVVNNAKAVLTDYLSPASWNWSNVVRRNDLIALISSAEGVDYVDSLSVPATDFDLDGIVSLADTGTLTITVI